MSGFIAPAPRIMQFFKHKFNRKPVWQLLGLILADVLLFAGTNARNVAAYLVVVGFLLMSATLYFLLKGILAVLHLYGLPLRHRRRAAACLTGLVSGLVALQSIGELGPRDVLVVLPLAGVAYLYSFYGAGSRKARLS